MRHTCRIYWATWNPETYSCDIIKRVFAPLLSMCHGFASEFNGCPASDFSVRLVFLLRASDVTWLALVTHTCLFLFSRDGAELLHLPYTQLLHIVCIFPLSPILDRSFWWYDNRPGTDWLWETEFERQALICTWAKSSRMLGSQRLIHPVLTSSASTVPKCLIICF